MYMMGWNVQNQLGIGSTQIRNTATLLTGVLSTLSVQLVSCGFTSTVLLGQKSFLHAVFLNACLFSGSDNRVYAMGANSKFLWSESISDGAIAQIDFGQLGVGDNGLRETPTLVSTIPRHKINITSCLEKTFSFQLYQNHSNLCRPSPHPRCRLFFLFP